MRMDPARRARLVALGDLHREWVVRSTTDATFDPAGRVAGSDYNQHYVDVDASPVDEDAFHNRARQIMGIS